MPDECTDTSDERLILANDCAKALRDLATIDPQFLPLARVGLALIAVAYPSVSAGPEDPPPGPHK